MRVLPLAGVAPVPWRNGGGVTRELLAWPAAQGEWACRISVAEVSASGPFSAWPGVERWFAVLHGDGVRLALPGGPRVVRAGDEPVVFDGAEAPQCALTGGATLDLNLMLRGSRGAMQRAVAHAPWRVEATLRACFVPAAARVLAGDAEVAVDDASLVWRDDGDATPWTVSAPAWWLWCQPR